MAMALHIVVSLGLFVACAIGVRSSSNFKITGKTRARCDSKWQTCVKLQQAVDSVKGCSHTAFSQVAFTAGYKSEYTASSFVSTFGFKPGSVYGDGSIKTKAASLLSQHRYLCYGLCVSWLSAIKGGGSNDGFISSMKQKPYHSNSELKKTMLLHLNQPASWDHDELGKHMVRQHFEKSVAKDGKHKSKGLTPQGKLTQFTGWMAKTKKTKDRYFMIQAASETPGFNHQFAAVRKGSRYMFFDPNGGIADCGSHKSLAKVMESYMEAVTQYTGIEHVFKYK